MLLVTVRPTRAPRPASRSDSSRRRDWSVNVSVCDRRPRETRRNSARLVRRPTDPSAPGPGFRSSRKALRLHSAASSRPDERSNGGPRPRAARSGGELLATPRAARGENPAAADRRRTGAKAMTALAHQLARLIGPFHRSGLRIQSRAKPVQMGPASHGQTASRDGALRPGEEAGKSMRRSKRRP